MLCCDLLTVRAFLSTEDCCQWCNGTPCIADNIAKFDCVTASVKSLTKQQYVTDMCKHWGTWGSSIKKCICHKMSVETT
jgi:molybdopterin/thiamine biosynthesis adenylyltransferase